MQPEHTVEYDMLLEQSNKLMEENKRLERNNDMLKDHIVGLQSCLDRIGQLVEEGIE